MRRRAVWAVLFAMAAAGGGGLVTWADGPAPSGPAVAERMRLDEFRKRLDARSIIAIDVRSKEAYENGHIPGSLSRPLGTLESWAPGFKGAGKTVVAYCA